MKLPNDEIIHYESKDGISIDITRTELVRCKDCKWRGKAGCAFLIVDESDKPKDDDFCSYGERKEQEHEEQAEFINDLKEQMLVATNMTENEAYDFAFRVWQHQDYLHWYIEMKWGDDNG